MIDQPTRPNPAAAGLAVLVLAAALAGCGSSHHANAAHSTAPTLTAPSGAVAATGTPAPADVAAAVTRVYTQFVEPGVPIDQKVAMVQDGAAFEPSMQALSTSDFAKEVTVTVSAVRLVNPNLASVTYSILIQNSPVLPNASGYAINDGGTWKVAGETLCQLLQANDPTLPAPCSQAVATALPN
jgi:hypothetical protein